MVITVEQFLFSIYHQATKDLENYDKERHEEFKRYEMMKEHDRREHLKTLDDEERKKEEEHYEEMKKKHADHPKVNHPVSDEGAQRKINDIFCWDFFFFVQIVIFILPQSGNQMCFYFNDAG